MIQYGKPDYRLVLHIKMKMDPQVYEIAFSIRENETIEEKKARIERFLENNYEDTTYLYPRNTLYKVAVHKKGAEFYYMELENIIEEQEVHGYEW